MTTESEAKFIEHYDVLTTRLAQAAGVLAALNTLYAANEPIETGHHPLTVSSVRDALWAVTELLDQADNAAVAGLGGCSFVTK
jgi:hypothetical protein